MKAMTHPTLVRVQAWSHTDRRQMLTLLDGIFLDPQQVLPGVDRAWMGAKLTPLALCASHPFAQEDAAVRAAMDIALTPQAMNHQPHATVSWSSRAPRRLRVHSIRFALGWHAADWTDFCADLPENKGRAFFVLTLLQPEQDCLSPR